MKSKVIFLFVWMSMAAVAGFAQDHMPARVNTYSDEGTGTGFRKENFFIGGGPGLGFAANQFSVGISPEAGYSLNRWLDAGIVLNFTYNSVSPDPSGVYNPDLSEKEFIYGGGLFARAYVLPFLYLTAQPEINWTHDKQTYEGNGGVTYIYKTNAPSLLLGIGYGHRMIGEGTYYFALMLDVLGNSNSPYNDIYGHPLPVIKAGFDLFPHKRY
ncbi:MAG TPA: hypothetical protein VFE32_16365 [Puia sp.]|nr:hypothetical protein [Puia sp.]